MGLIADALLENLRRLQEIDERMLADIRDLQSNVSRTINALEEEDRKMTAEERKEFSEVCKMTEEEYLEYLMQEA